MNTEQAIEEARTCLKVLNKRKLALPIYYDFEYDSEKYNTVSNSALSQIYISFMSHIKNYSEYRPGIYCDLNYYKRAARTAFNRFPNASLWLAHWSEISFENHVQVYNCDVMQYRSDGTVSGIYTTVDMDYCKPELLKNSTDDGAALNASDVIYSQIEKRYAPIVDSIIAGKYGNGEERKAELQKDGYDYVIAQWFVNRKLG